MAKRVTKKAVNPNEMDGKEFFEAIHQIEQVYLHAHRVAQLRLGQRRAGFLQADLHGRVVDLFHNMDGQRLKVYVVEVRKATKGPQVLISRTHPGLVKRLFELEVPEVFDGTVEIRSVAREAGSRTKMAVWSEQPNVDPIGACVGPRHRPVPGVDPGDGPREKLVLLGAEFVVDRGHPSDRAGEGD